MSQNTNTGAFKQDSYGNWIDPGGNVFNTKHTGVPGHGDQISIHKSSGTVAGTLVGTEAVPNKAK